MGKAQREASALRQAKQRLVWSGICETMAEPFANAAEYQTSE